MADAVRTELSSRNRRVVSDILLIPVKHLVLGISIKNSMLSSMSAGNAVTAEILDHGYFALQRDSRISHFVCLISESNVNSHFIELVLSLFHSIDALFCPYLSRISARGDLGQIFRVCAISQVTAVSCATVKETAFGQKETTLIHIDPRQCFISSMFIHEVVRPWSFPPVSLKTRQQNRPRSWDCHV
jgi:hypothetical protein